MRLRHDVRGRARSRNVNLVQEEAAIDDKLDRLRARVTRNGRIDSSGLYELLGLMPRRRGAAA